MTQKEALKVLKMGKNVFLTGPAGSGKTYVLNQYIQFLKEYGVEVAVTASTGIAATHLKGITIHSWSGIGIKDRLTDYDLDMLEQKQYLWKRFQKTKVLIIDEISMLSANTLNCVDQVAKLFKRNDLPFGGMQVVFSGDFFQLPPITKRAEWDVDGVDETQGVPFAFKSKVWGDSGLHTCYLSEQFRQEDDVLLDLLYQIREGNFLDKHIKLLNQRVTNEEIEDITKLYTHNVNVDSFNEKKLLAIDEPEKLFKMTSKGKPNLVEALKRGCLVSENLILKKGALVMFVKNNPTVGYVNGTVGEVLAFRDGYPVVVDKNGEQYEAVPQSWSIEEGNKVLAKISQVPLKLAWAVTIHKSQGMTLDRALIDLSSSFVEGQGYVALSRVKTLDGLYLKGFNQMALEVHPEVRKVDKALREKSEELFEEVKRLNDEKFEEKHQLFLEKVEAKKHKVLDKKGKKLNTYQITKGLLEQRKNLEEIAKERDLKKGTIVNHIEKLLDEGIIKRGHILYLRPKTEKFEQMFKAVQKAVNASKDNKLTPIFKALNGKYSFEEIRFAKIFM